MLRTRVVGTSWNTEGDTGGGPVAGVVAVVGIGVVGLALSRVLFPYDLGHFEGGVWAPAELLVHGGNPYELGRTSTPPFVMAPYGPVYYGAVGVGLAAFGPQFWFGRAVAAGAMLLAATCLAVLGRRFTGRRDLGLLAALAFLAAPATQLWIAVQRPDGLALLLSLAALTVTTAPRPHDPIALATIVLCLIGAMLTRQTTMLPWLATVTWLLAAGHGGAARTVGVLVPVVVVGVTMVLNAGSSGGYLWQQFILPSSVPQSTAQLATILGILARAPASWIVLALGIAGVTGVGWAAPTALAVPAAARFRRLVLGYFLVAAALAALTSARAGSNVNYWLEPAALAALLAAFGAGRLPLHGRATVLPAVVLAVAALLGLRPLWRAETARWTARPALDAIVRRIATSSASTPVLTVYPELAVLAGRAYWFNDAIQYAGRSPAHSAALRRELAARTFEALVLPYDRAPAGYERASTMPSTSPPAFLFVRR